MDKLFHHYLVILSKLYLWKFIHSLLISEVRDCYLPLWHPCPHRDLTWSWSRLTKNTGAHQHGDMHRDARRDALCSASDAVDGGTSREAVGQVTFLHLCSQTPSSLCFLGRFLAVSEFWHWIACLQLQLTTAINQPSASPQGCTFLPRALHPVIRHGQPGQRRITKPSQHPGPSPAEHEAHLPAEQRQARAQSCRKPAEQVSCRRVWLQRRHWEHDSGKLMLHGQYFTVCLSLCQY